MRETPAPGVGFSGEQVVKRVVIPESFYRESPYYNVVNEIRKNFILTTAKKEGDPRLQISGMTFIYDVVLQHNFNGQIFKRRVAIAHAF